MHEYNMPPLGLYGKRCRIPHVSDKERGFVYRIVNSGIRSNVWKEPPLGRYYNDNIQHDHMEDVLIVVCDTLIDENSKLERVALKDVVIMDETDNSVLEDIKDDIENMLSDGMIHKKTVIGILDKHISGKEQHEEVGRTLRENE